MSRREGQAKLFLFHIGFTKIQFLDRIDWVQCSGVAMLGASLFRVFAIFVYATKCAVTLRVRANERNGVCCPLERLRWFGLPSPVVERPSRAVELA